MPAIVFEFFDSLVFKDSYRQFSEDEIKVYVFELLRALEFVHTCGIMHRDVKVLGQIRWSISISILAFVSFLFRCLIVCFVSIMSVVLLFVFVCLAFVLTRGF
jgi:serine/threonine protein kinase